MRHFIFSFNSGGFLQPTTELLSEGLAASVLEAGCPDTREGGPAATLTRGLGLSRRLQALQAASACPIPCSACCVSGLWFLVPKVGRGSTCRAVVRRGWPRRRRHRLSFISVGISSTLQAARRHLGHWEAKGLWAPAGQSGNSQASPCWRAPRLPTPPEHFWGCLQRGHTGAVGRLHEAAAWQPSTVPAAPSAD